jgi:Transposase
MRIRLSNFGYARIDAGAAWCVRARETAWRGDPWDRSLLLRARRRGSYTGGPLRPTASIAVRRELSCGCDGWAVRGTRRDDVVATVRVPGQGRRRWDQQTRTFRATLGGLAELAAWLAEFGVTLVGMEATGVYWKTVFQALEDRLECWLLNAHHLRNVPGRNTDVKDSEWICQLVQHGLVRPSLVPPPEIRRLRDLTRLRKAQTNERGRSIQRLEKVLQFDRRGFRATQPEANLPRASGRRSTVPHWLGGLRRGGVTMDSWVLHGEIDGDAQDSAD